MEMRIFRPFEFTSVPDFPWLVPESSRENPGNDSAAVIEVWQPSSPKRKQYFLAAALAGPSALIKDNVPREAYEQSRQQRLRNSGSVRGTRGASNVRTDKNQSPLS